MQKYSVALCTYNGAKYIGEQLNSIIKQTVAPSQIVISDDGSKDETLTIVENILCLNSIEYSIVHNTVKHGVTSNFQNAFSFCSNPIIFCSDQDDVWKEDKAEKMLKEYDNHPEAMVVFSDGELVNSELNHLGCNVWKAVGITPERINKGDWFHYLIKNCLITGAAMSFKKELLEDVDLIPTEWLHDGWLAWVAVSHNGLVPCNEKLFYYRQHVNNEIGMKPVYNICGRLKGYFKNFDDVKNTRRIRYKRYSTLYSVYGKNFIKSQQEEIQKCISFWEDMIKSETCSKSKALRSYIRHYLIGDYAKFYNSFYGFVRDVLIIFMKKY